MHVLRKLSFAVGLTAVMATQHAMALGLGSAEVKSALNQPLQADIRLSSVEGMSRDDLIIRLAPSSAFENAGITRLEFYNQLRFELILDHESGPIVRVTSREPVREPYLNFLVEARWASGRLMREYTMLLDLPVFDEDRAQQPVQAAARERETVRPSEPSAARERPAPTRQAETPSTPTRSTATGGGDVYGPVGSNDTLWDIALKSRPGRDVSVQQTMLAIQRANPDAFINGNINLLRRGQVLRLPNREEIQSLAQAQAVSQVAQQNRDWNESRGAQLDAGRRVASQPRQASEAAGQVTLASPASATGGGAGQSGGASESRGQELENELAATLEELDKSRRENRELASRVRDLESQIETMESLIQASNEQLRALQLASEQARQAAGDADTRDFVPDLMPEDEQTDSDIEQVAGQTEQTEVEQEVAPAEEADEEQTEVAAAPAARDPSRVVRSTPPQPTLLDRLMENLLALIGGLLVLILGAAYFVMRRKQAAEGADNFEEEFGEDDFLPPEADAAEFQEEAEEGIELADDAGEDFDNFDTLSDEETSGTEAETGDVVGEADIYIAYGKLDQAEEMLLKGLAKEPNSAPILLKLLEVYSETQDAEAFDRHYGALLGTDDRAAIQRAGELRESIPGAGDFDISAHTVAAQAAPAEAPVEKAAAEDADELDLGSLDLEPEEETAAESGDDELTFGEDLSFDLEDDEPTAPETAEADVDSASSRYDLSFEETADGEQDEDFAFDLELDDETDNAQTDTGADKNQPALDSGDLEFDLSLEDDTPSLELADEESSLELDDDAPKLELEEAPSLELDEDVSDLTLEAPEEPALEDAQASTEADAEEDDFSFDFEPSSEADDLGKLDEELSGLDDEPSDAAKTPALDLHDEDDFDPNLDVGSFDLEALDKEMGELDDVAPSADPAPLKPAPADTASLDEDGMFEEALSGLDDGDTLTEVAPAKTATPVSDEDMDAELDFLADADEAATKLDLARAYIDMGDTEGAKDILSEVRQEGNDEQKREAEELLTRMD
ncbi:FimV/HubP family polar landmark protein [Marinimicrobium sp. ABcell2]|uniref:FimV/HubP family polar landmark protein n=1 Tax=Marinimicrobium sp. ABcell2 TaxID=3069751 RepID=UPI0027B4514C|nr:FimV/HubP family polar landmark protein [Marinimicrobium sp. ABcell2]MDQ2075531.1 FimV/HubP family polar landmark protein [Marinimicrobium sp. ABcell2]